MQRDGSCDRPWREEVGKRQQREASCALKPASGGTACIVLE